MTNYVATIGIAVFFYAIYCFVIARKSWNVFCLSIANNKNLFERVRLNFAPLFYYYLMDKSSLNHEQRMSLDKYHTKMIQAIVYFIVSFLIFFIVIFTSID